MDKVTYHLNSEKYVSVFEGTVLTLPERSETCYHTNAIKKIMKQLSLKNKITKIILNDFPDGDYILQLNGYDFMVAKKIFSDYIFDFYDSNTLSSYDENEDIIFLKNCIEGNCINFDKIECIRLFCDNSGFMFNEKKEIKLHGYFNENKSILSKKILNIYPHHSNSYEIWPRETIESVDILFDTDKTTENAKMILLVDDEEYTTINIDKTTKFIRIKFTDIKNDLQFYKLEDNILNMNKINKIQIVTLNTMRTDIIENHYRLDKPITLNVFCE